MAKKFMILILLFFSVFFLHLDANAYNINDLFGDFGEVSTIDIQNGPSPLDTGYAWNYASIVNPIKKTNPADCKPFAVGDLSSGNLSLHVGLPAFSSGVDIYLAIQSNVLGDGALFLIDQDYNFQIASTILPRWKTNITAAIDESLYGDIPISLLPSGLYNLYIAVVPTGETNFSHFYFWSTSFSISAEPSSPICTEPNLTLYKKSSSSLFGSSDYDEISFPYFCERPNCFKQVNATVLGTSTYTHQTYKLVAKGKDFTITSTTATDLNGSTNAWFEGLEEGTIIHDGEELEFSLVSMLTGGHQALLQWSFEVDNEGVQFIDTVSFQSN